MRNWDRASTAGQVQSDETELRSPFRPDIEGLRGLAVILVVAFHAGIPALQGGFVGVDVFFAISGYLITGLLLDEARRTGTIALAAFYARRAQRLIPAATVVLIVTLIAAAVALPPLQQLQTAAGTRTAGLYASNMYFASLASDYFSGDVKSNPVLHTWSLSVEEQFYLVWPVLLLWLVGRRRDTAAFSTRRAGWALALIASMSFAAACWYTTANHSMAFYGTPLRAWEFAVGGLAGLNGARSATLPTRVTLRWLRAAVGWLGLGAMLAAASSYSPATDFPGFAALLPVLGTAMVLFADAGGALDRAHGAARVLAIAPLRWIGQRSYSWYLWHWPVLVIGMSVLATPSLSSRACLVGFALLLADLTYRYVEVPTRTAHGGSRARNRGDRADSWRVLRRAAVAASIVVGAAEATQSLAAAAARQPLQRAFTAAASDIPRAYADACVDAAGDATVKVCTYGDTSSRTVIALFGDSHALQWLPALESTARTRGWALLVIGKSRCATADVPVYVADTRTLSVECRVWRNRAIDTLVARGVQFVVLSNTGWYVRDSLRPGFPGVSAGAWRNGMSKTLRRLRDGGVLAVVVQDTPLLNTNVPICLARSGWVNRFASSCGTSRTRAISVELADAERGAVATVVGDRVIDLTNVLCQPARCPAMVNGFVAYSDREHLTASLSRSLASVLSHALDESGVTASLNTHPRATRRSLDN